MARKTTPHVTEKKLGRERAAGLAHFDDNRIDIDPRQDAYEFLDTLLHEHTHLSFPEWQLRELIIDEFIE